MMNKEIITYLAPTLAWEAEFLHRIFQAKNKRIICLTFKYEMRTFKVLFKGKLEKIQKTKAILI